MYLFSKLITFLILVNIIISDNIDTEFPIKFSFQKSDSNSRDNENINGSYFGFTLAANQQIDDRNNQLNYVLIGATKYDSGLYAGKDRTGAIFKCQWNERQSKRDVVCTEIDFRQVDRVEPMKGMNLGSSLSTNTNSFVGCGHLWVRGTSPVGKCYQISNQGLIIESFGPNPGNGESVTRDGRPWHSHLMYGFSSFATQSEDSYFLGGPGYRDYMGSVLRYKDRRDQLLDLKNVLSRNDLRLTKINSYLGYSVTTGFFDSNSEYVVISAPRNKMFNGQVLVYPLAFLFQKQDDFGGYLVAVNGESDTFGEYFGASLLTLNTNNDKFEDLIVGAPLYSNQTHVEVGRVYVFLINEKGTEFKKRELIFGHKSNSRFGSALSSININLDEFNDLVVGAPFEANSDGSLGAVYIYLGSPLGLVTEKPQMRIGAESMKNVVLNGFGISIFSNVDFDGNGYNDLLIGSYLSENAILLRTKPMANLSVTNIDFKPNKIRLNDKNCVLERNKQNSCFRVNYCVNYEGKFIRDRVPALITLEITDSKLRVRENRVRIDNIKRSEQKLIELRANQRNCFEKNNSFTLYMSDADILFDIITPIEVKLTVELRNQSSDVFCKNCAIASIHSSFAYINFEHGCQRSKCVSRLTLLSTSKYSGQIIEKNLIEGLHDTIDVEISVTNSGEASINTVLVIHMTPVLLTLTNSGEHDRCMPMMNESSYRCDVSKILQKNKKEDLNLHFVVSRIPSNHLNIDLKLESSSDIERTGSKLMSEMQFEIIRKANLMLSSEPTNSFSYSDKIRSVSFPVHFSLVKEGPSTIDMAYLIIQLPTDIIVLDGESLPKCETILTGSFYKFPVVNNTIDLSCDQRHDYCSKYKCRLPQFNSGGYKESFSLFLALIPSRVQDLDYKGINFKLNSELKIDDKIRFETDIKSFVSTDVFMARDVPIIDAKVEPWVLFVSSGLGIFFLVIAVIVLIKCGFFKRKKLEEIEKVKLRMSMRPDFPDINVLDMTEEELDEMQN